MSSDCNPKCGDGLVFPPEVCDDQSRGGCKSDCTGSNDGFNCTEGDTQSPSICILI